MINRVSLHMSLSVKSDREIVLKCKSPVRTAVSILDGSSNVNATKFESSVGWT